MRSWPRRPWFWRELSPGAVLSLVLAVGLTFSSLSFLRDVTSLESQPFSNALYGAVLSGLTAISVFLGLARDLRWLVVALALQVAGGFFLRGPARQPPWVGFTTLSRERRLELDSFGALVLIIAGYNAFVVFISGEGKRRAAISAEMKLAHRIHRTLVPDVECRIDSTRFHGFSRPSGQVGGDLVDVIVLPDGEWLAYVADVAGHGVSSGLVTGMVKSAMRMGVQDRRGLPDLVGRVNRLLCGQLTGSMYVTLGAIRGGSHGEIEVLIAGHPPLLRMARGGAEVEAVAAAHVPLGFSPDWDFSSTRIHFRAGDLLVLITDGLFEVFDRTDRDLGFDGVKELVAGARHQSLSEIAERVFHGARSFGPQLDDQTILLASRTA